MKYKLNKKEKFMLVVYLLTIFFIGIGSTFSYFLLVDSAKKDSTKVYAGSLNVKYNQGSRIIADTLYPISDPDFYETEMVYRNEFSVSSVGTLEQNISINFDVSNNSFSNNAIKYVLYYKNGRKVSTGYLNGTGNIVIEDNMYFKENETKDFILLIWLEEKPYDQTNDMGQKLSGIIRVYSKQYGY